MSNEYLSDSPSRRRVLKAIGTSGVTLGAASHASSRRVSASSDCGAPIWAKNYSSSTEWECDGGTDVGVGNNFGIVQTGMAKRTDSACGGSDYWHHRFSAIGVSVGANEYQEPAPIHSGQTLDVSAAEDYCTSGEDSIQLYDSWIAAPQHDRAEEWLEKYHDGQNENEDTYDKACENANRFEDDHRYLEKHDTFSAWDAAVAGGSLGIAVAGVASSSAVFPFAGATLAAVSVVDALADYGNELDVAGGSGFTISGNYNRANLAVHYADFAVHVPVGEEQTVTVDHDVSYDNLSCTTPIHDIEENMRTGVCYDIVIRDDPETFEPYAEQCGRR